MLTEEMTGSSGLLPLTVERSRQCGLEEPSDRLVGIRYYVLEYPECGWPTRTGGGSDKSRAYENGRRYCSFYVCNLTILINSRYLAETLCFTFFLGSDQSPGNSFLKMDRFRRSSAFRPGLKAIFHFATQQYSV